MLRRGQEMRTLDEEDRVVVDKAIANAHLVDFIENSSHSFSFVGQSDFIVLCVELNDKSKVPGQTATRENIIQPLKIKHLEIKNILSRYERHLSLTTKMWTTIFKQSYTVITAHFIDKNWIKRHLVVTFKRVIFPHTAEHLAQYNCEAVHERKLLERL